mmetsp:Transcript_32103/g.76257  ORF Transcript_32103/g.76257 Transcript_32103/m.76257 type:complete len:167 (-) Transcript_32103:58-558(-)
MPWRDLVFPSEGEVMVFPTRDMMHPIGGPSSKSLDRPPSKSRLPLSISLDAINNECSKDAGGLAYHVAEEVEKFHHCTTPISLRLSLSGWLDALISPVNTSPQESLPEWFDALNNEGGVDAVGHDASISSGTLASGKEEAACFCKSPEHRSWVQGKLPTLVLDAEA